MVSRTAAPSFLGYEYQTLQAMLLVIPSGIDSKVYIERFDDVFFESNDGMKIIIQNKFSLKDSSKITSIEPAFWNSISNWIDLINSQVISEEYHFLLVTTRDTEDPLIALLENDIDNRNNKEILNRLDTIAKNNKGKNRKTEKHITKYLSLSTERKVLLISKIQIFTSQPNITQIQDKINTHLKDYCHEEYFESFCNSVYGWWYRQVISRLSQDVKEPITHKDLFEAIKYFRDKQIGRALPQYFSKSNKYKNMLKAFDNFKFVKQLKIIDLDNESILDAMNDYYIASEHRKRWVRELNPIINDSLIDYDEQLKSKWFSRFTSQHRQLQKLKSKTPKLLLKYGIKIFEWMDNYDNYPAELKMESGMAKIWMWKGSFHVLSNNCEIGWHPNFKELLCCEKYEHE